MAYNESSKKATMKYMKEHLKRVPLSIPKETYEWVKMAAEYVGEPVTLFIKRATYERAALEFTPDQDIENAARLLEEKRAERKRALEENYDKKIVDGVEVLVSKTTEVKGKTTSGYINSDE